MKLARKSTVIGWFLALFVLTGLPSSQAAPEVLFNDPGPSGCVTPYSSGATHAQKFIAKSSVTISSIEAYIGTGSQTNFSNARFYIMSSDANGYLPVSILETFTPSTISGTGGYTLAKFVGSYTATLGSKFWIVAGQAASTFPWCSASGLSATTFTQNGVVIDTSTSLNNTNFRRAYLTTGSISAGPWTTVEDVLVWLLKVSGNINSSVVSVQLALQSGGRTATYRTLTSLVSTVDKPSRVTFTSNGKYISGCRNILSSGGTATCNWLPSIHGAAQIIARAVPTDVAYTASASILNVGVIVRSNAR